MYPSNFLVLKLHPLDLIHECTRVRGAHVQLEVCLLLSAHCLHRVSLSLLAYIVGSTLQCVKPQRVVCSQEIINDLKFIRLSFEIFRPYQRPRSRIAAGIGASVVVYADQH